LEKWNNDTFYRYKAEYHEAWTVWINTRLEYRSWLSALPQDKRLTLREREMKWGNADVRSSQYWEHFPEGASSRGVPQLRCIYCSHIIQHPFKNGSSGMKDHYGSKKCSKVRREKGKDPKIMDVLRKQGEKVARSDH
jgi:hypothetical protein